MDPVSLGVVGCGSVSDVYFEAGERFDAVDVVACADVDAARAEAKAEAHGVPAAASVDDLLANPDVEGVVVLTPPAHHADVAVRALSAGKHVYTEKPLAATVEAGAEVRSTAAANGLLVGAAPDTFLGAGLGTCRDAVDAGRIGEPVGATVFWGNRGHEHWHPDPEGFYGPGGGPLFDMGPYYLTALVFLLGPVERVAGAVRKPFERREITSEPNRGAEIDVEVPTHETGILEFESGATATVVTSFDVWGSELPGFEIHGTEGTLSVTDPNRFDGTPRVHAGDGEEGWRELAVTRDHPGQARGLGLVDLARAVRTDWEQRASGALAAHVLEVVAGVRDASERGAYVAMDDPCARPPPVPENFPEDR